MDWRTFLVVWSLCFSVVAQNPFGKSGFLLENENTLKFVPIPLPWGNENNPRQLNLTVLMKTDARTATVVKGSSVNPELFDFSLSLINGQIKVIVNVGGKEAVQFIDNEITPNQPTEMKLSIDFDAMSISMNGNKINYNNRLLDRVDDSLILVVGGKGFFYGCVGIEELTVSGDMVKLEESVPSKFCNPENNFINVNDGNIENRGHGHYHPEDQKEEEKYFDPDDVEENPEKSKGNKEEHLHQNQLEGENPEKNKEDLRQNGSEEDKVEENLEKNEEDKEEKNEEDKEDKEEKNEDIHPEKIKDKEEKNEDIHPEKSEKDKEEKNEDIHPEKSEEDKKEKNEDIHPEKTEEDKKEYVYENQLEEDNPEKNKDLYPNRPGENNSEKESNFHEEQQKNFEENEKNKEFNEENKYQNSEDKIEFSKIENNNQDIVEKKLNELLDQPDILEDYKKTTIEFEEKHPCFPHQRAHCGPNSRSCEGSSFADNRSPEADFRCECKSGYAGKRCQFSLFPKSCYEAFSLNSGSPNEPGPYEIDVDGSGPLRSTWAYCNKDAVTVVEHNMPNSTVIRSYGNVTDYYFPISYKLFPQIELKTLIENSFNCEQKVKYDCENAPLSFGSNLTWFEAATGKMIKQIGPDPDQCSCAKSGCESNRKCNCDSLKETFDEGILTGNIAGITTIFALKNPANEGIGKLTLSSLKCEGNSGHRPGNSITLKSPEASLDYSAENEIEHLEFEFRTIQENIEFLAYFETGTFNARISLKNGHIVSLRVREDGGVFFDTVIMSQKKLNDLRWHRILIEIIHEEIRFSVDDLNEFGIFNKKNFPSNLRFGHNDPESDSDGFIGCLRNVVLNRRPLAIRLLTKNLEEHFKEPCTNLCAGHNCEQESRCIEHFDTDTRSCQCKNKFIHKGERCEKNLNTDSEVSFHDQRIGFLRYSDKQLESNPLTNGIAFSVRTDQKQAVLIYVHDQSNNILQVHLADEYRIVLTVSNYTGNNIATISRCTVYSHKRQEFSDMRWLQIVVERTPERTPERTTLTVDEEQCEIKGVVVLASPEDTIYDYGIEDREIIFPPRAAGHVKILEPFQYLFVGGVKSQMGFDRRRRALDPLYQSFIPVFLGCMKGLVVGEQFVDMREGGLRPKDPEAVQTGCYTDCDSAIVCNNGGHCAFVWENRSPFLQDLTSCDCSKTSYFGKSCMKDVGATFDGTQSLLYRISASHDHDLLYNRQQTFRFAFSPETGFQKTQRIATAYFKNENELQVTLHPNASITVVYTGKPEEVHVFGSNFTDGHRHFFQATFEKNQKIRIVVDSDKQYFEEDLFLHLGNVVEFRFGGRIEEKEIFDSYHGCLSNVDIDFHRSSKTVFQPFLYYFNYSIDTKKYLIDEPDPNLKLIQSTCKSFLAPGVLPTLQRNVQFPHWDAVFTPISFQSNFTPSNDEIGPSGGIPWWVWLLLTLLLILLILCCLFFCRRKKQLPPIGTGARPEENYPLTKLAPEDPIQTMSSPDSVSVNDNFDIPKATENLFKNGTPTNKIPDRPSVSDSDNPMTSNKASVTSIYHTAQDYPDEDSIDAYSHDDPEDIDKQLAQGFGEEKPNIMDKKTYNMLEKTNPDRISSFAKEDHPSRSPKSPRQLTPAEVPRISLDHLNGV